MSDFKVPTGYKLVPIEPTQEMLKAGDAQFENMQGQEGVTPSYYGTREDSHEDLRNAYKKMLSIAPKENPQPKPGI